MLFQHLLSLLHPGSFSFPLLPSRHGLNSTFSGVLWNENDHCIEVQCLGHMRLCHNSQGLWITQAEPCYLCTLERHVHTEIPTIRKGNMWVHLRSPRWAMLSWYFTWKDRIGDCLWTWVNICVCCQNKNRRAHKQNKGYMGAVPRDLNRGGDVHVQLCTHTDTHTLTAHLLPLFENIMAGGNPVLPHLQKSVEDENQVWILAPLGLLRNPPTEGWREVWPLNEGGLGISSLVCVHTN